jgi:CO/xanthine dehydrogenase FAD-binding subunit
VKPPPFEYDAPGTVDEAIALLHEHASDAKVLAGGQSLVPLLNFRLARPGRLIDINGLGELSHIRRQSGRLDVGAIARQSALERSTIVREHWPLLHEAVGWVAHAQIRNRGTVGGSMAHADPAAELPVALTALDARFHLRGRAQTRVLAAGEFFVSSLTTALTTGELLVEIEVPPLPEGAATGFAEYARTHGDWAMAGAAVVRAAGHAAIALLGAAPTPVRAREAEQALVAGSGTDEAARLAGALVADPWRAALTTSLVRRALEEAAA